MALFGDNTTPFPPPIGNAPYFVSREWCMGDSLSIFNTNFQNFDTRIENLDTTLLQLSAQAFPPFIPNINDTTQINILIDPTSSIPSSTRATLNRAWNFYIKTAILPFYNNNEAVYNNRVTIKNFPGSGNDGERFLRALAQNPGSSTATKVINICIQDEAGPVYYPATTAFNPNSTRTILYNTDIASFRNMLSVTGKTHYTEIMILNTGSDFSRNNFGEFLYAIQKGIGQYTGNFGLSNYSNINPGQFNITYDQPIGVSAGYYIDVITKILTRINNL
jgi:hypothetical protein